MSISSNVATVSGTSTLAGAVTPLIDCVLNFQSYTGCSFSQAVRTVTVNPARVLGRRGELYVGGKADFLVWDEGRREVLETFVGGVREYFRAEEGG